MEAKWTIVVHEAAEGGCWAEVEELPGCFASGDTREELEADLRDATETYMASLAKIQAKDALHKHYIGSPPPYAGEGTAFRDYDPPR